MSTYYTGALLFEGQEDIKLKFRFNKELFNGWELPAEIQEYSYSFNSLPRGIRETFLKGTLQKREIFVGFSTKELLLANGVSELRIGKPLEGIETNAILPVDTKAVVRLFYEDIQKIGVKNLLVEDINKATDENAIAVVQLCNYQLFTDNIQIIKRCSLTKFIEVTRKEIERIISRRAQYNYIKNTLDYQKLPEDEKMNIYKEYAEDFNDYFDEDGELQSFGEDCLYFYRNRYDYAVFLDNLLNDPDMWHKEAYIFIYNTEDSEIAEDQGSIRT